MAKPVLPVTLQIGTTPAAQIGTVELPLKTGCASKAAGLLSVEVHVDQDELWKRIAVVLRDAAALFEKGPGADGE